MKSWNLRDSWSRQCEDLLEELEVFKYKMPSSWRLHMFKHFKCLQKCYAEYQVFKLTVWWRPGDDCLSQSRAKKVNLKTRLFFITYEVSSYLLFVIPCLTSSVGSLDILFFSFDLFESSNSTDSFWTCFWFLSLEFITVSEYKTVIFVKRSISKINKMSTLRISSI